MICPRELGVVLDQAKAGDMPPTGDLESADEAIGFSFGTYFDAQGQLQQPGPINEAIAAYIVGDEVLRSKNLTLQEELAVAVKARDRRLGDQIDCLPSIKSPFRAFNTHELITSARPGLLERQVGSLAVIGFRHHLPRAVAEIKKAGFVTATPDMRGVGDFDPNSGQPWTRSQEAWYRRERKVILAFALLNRI